MVKASRKFYSIPEAAALCGVSRTTLWNWVKSGRVKAFVTPGGHYRLEPKTVEALLKDEGPDYKTLSRPRRILIVDDDPQMLKVLAMKLSRLGLDVDTADNGFSAGLKVSTFDPEIVLLDLFMDGLDGFSVCRILKKSSGYEGLKIIAMTGHDSVDVRERILAEGADGYVAKSHGMETLMEDIMLFLLGSR